MAKIPLRSYLKEIENFIEHGEIDQAIAHAKNIFRSYPKQIDSYRLLGKAYLESQRYGEASDILQRVLSVIPDDFVSQIGMSIIREDEGNLDAAIWHMERAYEVQPFNPAVQDELRRLYGRRDGIEPPKIRLTRGALVRMYLRGELYPQAIAETRAALADDPQRLDLLVLLARLYYLANQKFEATEVCSTLISKLPYCLEANQILSEILPGTSRAEDAKKFQQRIYALDPYAAFITPTSPTSNMVPDQAVVVEKFIWDPSMGESQTPEWTRTIGVKWEETEEEVLPDWINTLKVAPSVTPPAQPIPTAPVEKQSEIAIPELETGASDELIPEFLKDAGWSASDRSADEIMAASEENEEIAPGEIPDWLQSIAPETVPTPESNETERTDWLETILIEPSTSSGAGSDQPPLAESQVSELPTTPDWISSEEQPQEVLDASQADLNETFSAWATTEEPPTTNQAETPSWLDDFKFEDTSPAQTSEDIPDWLKTVETETPQTDQKEDALPDWFSSTNQEPLPPTVIGQAEQPATEETNEISPPDWLKDFGLEKQDWIEPEPAEESIFEIPAPQDGVSFEVTATALPDAGAQPIQPLVDEIQQVVEEGPSTPDSSDMDAAMAWLESLAARQGADEATLITPPEQRLDFPPDWVTNDLRPEEEPQPDAETQIISGQPEEITPVLEEQGVESVASAADIAAPVDDSDFDATMAWLEGLAAQQGADEATLITPPDRRLENPPDWLLQEIEAHPQQTLAELPAEKAAEPDSTIPDWLSDAIIEPQTLEQPVETPSEPLVTESEGMIPDWVNETMLDPQLQETTVETPAELLALDADEETPDWLIEPIIETHPQEMPAESQVTIPDWLSESILEETPPEEPVSETLEISPGLSTSMEQDIQPVAAEEEAAPAPGEDFDSAFAWLESLAARQGADENTLITPLNQRNETAPEWVQLNSSAPAEITQKLSIEPEMQAIETSQEASEQVPDWLQSIEEEPPTDELELWKPETVIATELVGMDEGKSDELPDWLQVNAIEEEPAVSNELTERVPDWLSSIVEEEPGSLAGEPEPSVPTNDIRLAWEPEARMETPVAEMEPAFRIPSTTTDLQEALNRGNIDAALEGYNQLIQNGDRLSETIHALREALYRYPVDISVWQTLGDAYARNNQLQEALDAYTKAEELLR